jgi:hypothetical protein
MSTAEPMTLKAHLDKYEPRVPTFVLQCEAIGADDTANVNGLRVVFVASSPF